MGDKNTTTPTGKAPMDITKAKAKLAELGVEIKALIDAEIKVKRWSALKALGSVETSITSVGERLEDAVKRAEPRAKKSKKDRKAA